MKEVGIDISHNEPKPLTLELAEKADTVITMGCGAEAEGVRPAAFIQSEDWALEDPEGKPLAEIRKIRDKIRTRVERLVNEIVPEGEV